MYEKKTSIGQQVIDADWTTEEEQKKKTNKWYLDKSKTDKSICIY